MKTLLTLAAFTSALVSVTPAGADGANPLIAAAEAALHERLIQPLTVKDGRQSRFSRARLPPSGRRVRVHEAELTKDERGATFVTFAVDTRQGLIDGEAEVEWERDTLTGCVYPESGEVFVLRGDAYRPAAFLLGKKTPAAASHVCRTTTALGI